MRKTLLALIGLTALTRVALAAPETFDFKDPKGVNNIVFKLDAVLEATEGSANGITGSVTFDPENPGLTRGKLAVASASLHVPNPMMKGHLHGPQWMDVAKYPEIRFKSTRIETDSSGEYVVHGMLTIRDATREVALHVEEVTPETRDPWGNIKMGATARTKIRRGDFGLSWNMVLEAGGFLVGEEVSISIDAEMARRAG